MTNTNENTNENTIENENTNENVQATSTQNNVATIYKVKVIDKKQVQVTYDGKTYDGKLLNTNPSTHLHFNKIDVILPSKITIDGVQVSTKISGQANFIAWLDTLKGKTFTFDKSQRATSTKTNSIKASLQTFITSNENLANEYKQLLSNFEQAKTMLQTFIDTQQKAMQQANATTQLKNILASGTLTNEQIQALLQGGKNE